MPPATSNAGRVMPKMRKMYCPAAAKALRMTSAVSEAFRAVRTRLAGSWSAVTERNVGRAAKGSTRKKMELRARRENRT